MLTSCRRYGYTFGREGARRTLERRIENLKDKLQAAQIEIKDLKAQLKEKPE